jgi:preprotein translocase subunit SecE
MNSTVEAPHAGLDTLKLSVALILLIAALGGFYFFSDVSKLMRVLGLLGTLGVAIAIALQTEKGRALMAFASDSQIEVRKVVWPTRQETIQTTLAVMVVVFISAVILWGLDLILGYAMQFVMGQRG